MSALISLLAAIEAREAHSDSRDRTKSINARSLVEAALDAAELRMPQLTCIQRNYQPAVLTNVDPVLIQDVVTALVVAAGESLESGVRSSPSLIPSLVVSTDTHDGVRIRISQNAAKPPTELQGHGLDGDASAGAELRARRLCRALGCELWEEPGSPQGGTTFVVRFPAAGRW